MDDRVVGALVILVGYIGWKRRIWQSAWGALWGASERNQTVGTNQSMVLSLITAGGNTDTSGGTPSGDEWQQSGCNPGNYSCLNAWKARTA